MKIKIKYNKQTITLPILPSSFELTSPMQHTTVTLANGGQINLLGKEGLKTVNITAFFPASDYDFAIGEFKKPYKIIEKLESWKKKVVHITITQTNIDMDAMIESLSYGHNDGTKDVSYTIEFKEEKKKAKSKAKNKNVEVLIDDRRTAAEKAETKRKTKAVKSQTYTVKQGDTLTAISKKITGSSANWKAIYNTNKKTIGNNPNKIKPGMKLVIKV